MLEIAGVDGVTCRIYRGWGLEMGAGPAPWVGYDAPLSATEEMMNVRCGDDQGTLAPWGAEQAEVTARSSVVSEALVGASLREGTRLVVEAMLRLDPALPQDQIALRALAEFVFAMDGVDPGDEALAEQSVGLSRRAAKNRTTKGDLVALLVTMGTPVVIEQLGDGALLSECTEAAASVFSADVQVADASVIGLSGCLVYHRLYLTTDLNDPLFVPPNVPDAFRAVATESGLLAALYDSLSGSKKKHGLSAVHDLLKDTLGHTHHSENDEGEITMEDVTLADHRAALEAFIAMLQGSAAGTACGRHKVFVCHHPPGNPENEQLLCVGEPALSAHLGHGDPSGLCGSGGGLGDFQAYRFHTGYNPSGGWEVDLAGRLSDPWNEACVDSRPTTACPNAPLRFAFDGQAVTESAEAPYVLQLEWRYGEFQPYAWVVRHDDSTYYRDELFHRVKVGIDPSQYGVVNYRNLLSDRCLDPMTAGGVYGEACYGGSGYTDSAPYSNAYFRTLYPGLVNVDNAYIYPRPELVARLAVLLMTVKNVDQLTTLQAFAVLRLLTEGMVAIPLEAGPYAIVRDHDLSVAAWDAAVAGAF